MNLNILDRKMGSANGGEYCPSPISIAPHKVVFSERQYRRAVPSIQNPDSLNVLAIFNEF
jgi:hypothetical protein